MAKKLENMSKEELLDHADKHGVDVDKRWGADRLLTTIQEAADADARAAEAENAEEEESVYPPPPEAPEPGKATVAVVSDESDDKVEKTRKTADRMSKMGVDSIVTGWARNMAGRDFENAEVEAEGELIVIRIYTRHGMTPVTVAVKSWTGAGIEAALADAERQIMPGAAKPIPDESWITIDPILKKPSQESKDRLISYAVSNGIEISTGWPHDRILAEIKRVNAKKFG